MIHRMTERHIFHNLQPVVDPIFAGSNAPAPLENELEFVLPNVPASIEEATIESRVFSEYKELPYFKFRLMVYLNKELLKHDLGHYIAVYLECCPLNDWPEYWGFYSVRFSLTIINQRDYRISHVKDDAFSFSFDETDRGWPDFLSHFDLFNKGFLSDKNSITLRAAVAPVGNESYKLHRESSFDSRAATGFVGLRNHGATCYMNALLQILYHIGSFRKAVYQMNCDEDQAFGSKSALILNKKKLVKKKRLHSGKYEFDTLEEDMSNSPEAGSDFQYMDASLGGRHSTMDGSSTDESELESGSPLELEGWAEQDFREILREEEEEKKRLPSVSLALQNLFYKLYHSSHAVPCKELIRSFGWDAADAFTQQDTHELLKLLLDKVEEQMQNTSAEGCVKNMFEGSSETYIECIDIDYRSSRIETFEDIQLDVRGCRDIMDSLRKATTAETLDGDNMYEAEGHGKQRARKGIRFKKFPPVVILLLKRFDYDLNQMNTVKINDRFEFSKEIDLSEFCPNGGQYVLHAVSVHHGDINSGHYYAFCRLSNQTEWYRFDDEKVYKVNEFGAIEDNFGGYELEVLNAHLNGRKVPKRLKAFNAYILSYVRKELAEELLMPCDPEIENPQLNVRWNKAEKLRERRQYIRKMLSNYVKLVVFTPESFVGKRFMNLPIKEGGEKFVHKFVKTKTLSEIASILTEKFRSSLPQDAYGYFFYYVSGYESLCRFDSAFSGDGNTPCHQPPSMRTLQQVLDSIPLKDLKDSFDPTLYVMAVQISFRMTAPAYYWDCARHHRVIFNKYFDSLSSTLGDDCLICLNVMQVKEDQPMRTIADEVFSVIESFMEKKLISPHAGLMGRLNPSLAAPSNMNYSSHNLKAFIEIQDSTILLDCRGSVKKAKIYPGDVIVWSLDPSEERLAEQKNKASIGRSEVDLEPTLECEYQKAVIPDMTIDSSIDKASVSTLQRVPVGYAGYCPKDCPPLPSYLVFNFHDYIEKLKNSVTFSMRVYDPIVQLAQHQNVNGLLLEDYTESYREDTDFGGRSQDGLSADVSAVNPVVAKGNVGRGMDFSEEEDLYLHHPKGKPLINRAFDLDLRMSFKQVIKHVAWQMNMDPTHLLLFSEPPLMASYQSLPKHVDYGRRDKKQDVEPFFTLQAWLDSTKATLRRASSPYTLHLGIIPTHYNEWLQGPPQIKMRRHYILQLFNSKAECIWACGDMLTNINANVEALTVGDLVEHVRSKIPEECEALGVHKNMDLRLVNVLGEDRFEECCPTMLLSHMEWFCNDRLFNTFRYPLRIEPALTEHEQESVRAGLLKEVTVIHHTPPPEREIFGHPFQILVKPNATMAEIKVTIKDKLKLPQKYWNQYRGWYQADLQRKSWKANADSLDWNNEKAVLVVEHSMPYSKMRSQIAMKIA